MIFIYGQEQYLLPIINHVDKYLKKFSSDLSKCYRSHHHHHHHLMIPNNNDPIKQKKTFSQNTI
mgnify:FL=1